MQVMPILAVHSIWARYEYHKLTSLILQKIVFCCLLHRRELVALRPEDFLPDDNRITIHNPETKISIQYVSAQDGYLRRRGSSSPHVPPFRLQPSRRPRAARDRVHVFLVAINAEVRFRSYFEDVAVDLPEGIRPYYVSKSLST